jgi:hypothetical protein
MWKRLKDIANIAGGIACTLIFLALLFGAKYLNDIIEAPTYTLSVFNCRTKPCEWVQDRGAYDNRAECEKDGQASCGRN